MKLGILAHSFGQLPVHELAKQVNTHGFSYIQLALAKAIHGIDTRLGALSPGLGHHIGEAFDREGVRIAVLGCYFNPLHPDETLRRYGIDRFKEHLRFARDFGTRIVATETGSLDADYLFHPDNRNETSYQAVRAVLEELAEEAERWGTFVGIEVAATHAIHSPERMERLLADVPSSNIGIVLDPVNLLDAVNIGSQDDVIEDAFRRLGSRIVLVHAKDAQRTAGGDVSHVAAGQGELNYALLGEKLRACKPHVDVVLESVLPEETAAAADYVRRMLGDNR